jgi:nucleoside phosphorylase/CheY-like chemotaxis protein
MISTLVIDDDAIKREHIVQAIRSIPELAKEDISTAGDLVQARDLLSKRFFDLLILDILLPPIPGAKPTPEAGIQFVKELRLSNTLIKPAHVIGLTAFDSAVTGATPAFTDELWKVIKYDPTTTGWSTQLKTKVLYLLQSKREVQSGKVASYDFDLGILTALWRPELKAVLELPLAWEKRIIANDPTEYYVGAPKIGAQTAQVVAASCSQMGIASAAVLAMKLINHFRPRYLAVCGIAAGVKDAGVNLGDILIVEQSWDYESGKRRANDQGEAVLQPDPHYIPIAADLRERFANCTGNDKYVREIEQSWTAAKPHSPLRAILGPVATGAAVVQDSKIVAAVQDHARKLIGIEMETYGAFFAAQNCCKPRPTPLAAKSVVDFADSQKNDSAQDYAAFTSAQYLWRFALENLLQPGHSAEPPAAQTALPEAAAPQKNAALP